MADQLIGKMVGGYEIVDRIGEGGMAAVYLARQQSMDRHVALKMLPQQFISDDTYLQRFEREVKIVSQLEHRNIVPVYDYGEHEGQPYIVMRYMATGSVDDLLNPGPLDLDLILSIIEQIAPALDYAHSKDVLHRDLKPSNILLDDNGGAFLTDFGIARMLGDKHPGITTQGVVGTPSYMSPEQAQGKTLDGRSDVYALGVMLFEMATGRRPFESETAYSVAVMQVTQPPPLPRSLNPALSFAIESVILKALKKNRDHRYPTCIALAEALRLSIERPTAVHDTEPSIKPLQRPDTPPAQRRVPPSEPGVPYQPTPSSQNLPPASIGSRVVQRRKQSPLISAVIGGGIGCGLLGALLIVGFLVIGFLLPKWGNTTSALQEDVTSTRTLAANPTRANATISPSAASANPSATTTLDPTSFAARETLISRDSTHTATVTGNTNPATSPTPTRTPGIDPIGVRGTPQLPDWLADVSGQIVFADLRGENRTLEIITLNLETWVETQLTDMPNANNSYPAPAPDGSRIAFQSDFDGDFDIFIMNTSGGELQKMTFNDYRDRLATWSPDGLWIYYSSDVRDDGSYDLRRVAVDGSVDEEVFSNGLRLSHPRISPDGKTIIMTVGSDPRNAATWEIGRLDLETKEMTLLTHNETRDASPVFSPDGKTILYATFDGADNALATMDLNGENQQILYDSSGSDWAANYSPDGRFIIMTSAVSGEDQLYLMTSDGKQVQAITSEGGLYASWIP